MGAFKASIARRLILQNLKKIHNLPVGAFMHGDTSGKIAQPSLGGSQYFILYKDDTSCYWFVFMRQQQG